MTRQALAATMGAVLALGSAAAREAALTSDLSIKMSDSSATDTDTAATIFYVAKTGADSPPCGPSATPCLTLQAAVDKASAGDAVIVRTGSYNQCVVIKPGIGTGGLVVESDEFFTSGTF